MYQDLRVSTESNLNHQTCKCVDWVRHGMFRSIPLHVSPRNDSDCGRDWPAHVFLLHVFLGRVLPAVSGMLCCYSVEVNHLRNQSSQEFSHLVGTIDDKKKGN